MYCRDFQGFSLFLNELILRMRTVLEGSPHGIDVEVKRHTNRRTSAQNAYYWLLNGWVADFLNQSGLTYGEFELPYNKDIIHEINKKIQGFETTTKMDIGEFCTYMNSVIMFWFERTRGEFQVPETPANYMIERGYGEFLRPDVSWKDVI